MLIELTERDKFDIELEVERRFLEFIRKKATNISADNYNRMITECFDEQMTLALARYNYTKEYIDKQKRRLMDI